MARRFARGLGRALAAAEVELLGADPWRFDASAFVFEAPEAACGRCGSAIGPHEAAAATGCTSCRRGRPVVQRVVRLGAYEGDLRRAVTAVKFGADRRAAAGVGSLLGVALSDALAEAGLSPSAAVLVPVPMPWRRRMGRGIDHAAVIARSAGREMGAGVVVGALRQRHHRPQHGLGRAARRANLRDAFRGGPGLGRLRSVVKEGAGPVVLVDDVRTTGTTLATAGRALRRLVGTRGGPGAVKIWAGVVCVADDGSRKQPDGGGVGGHGNGG